MASCSQNIEIGWKKQLLEDKKEEGETSCNDRRSRDRERKKKKEYNRLESDSSSSSSSSSSSHSGSRDSSSSAERKRKKCEKQEKRDKRKEEKKLKKEKHRAEKEKKREQKKAKKEKRKEEKRLKKMQKKMKECGGDIPGDDTCDFSIPIELMYSKARAPETPQEYQARQNKVRRVTDPETGRTRLIKGDGEILEEIVSRERHMEINRNATLGDGQYFQARTVGKTTKS